MAEEEETYGVDTFEEPLYSELVRLEVAQVTAAEYSYLAYLGGDVEAIAAALQQCSSWEEAIAWAAQGAEAAATQEATADESETAAQELEPSGSAATDDHTEVEPASAAAEDPSSWVSLTDPDSGVTYYQPLGADGFTHCGQWLWGQQLAEMIVESLAGGGQEWMRQLDEDAQAEYYLFSGPEGGVEGCAHEIGAWFYEPDFIAQNLTVISEAQMKVNEETAAKKKAAPAASPPKKEPAKVPTTSTPSKPAGGKSKVAGLAQMFDQMSDKTPNSKGGTPGEAKRTAKNVLEARQKAATKAKEDVDKALSETPNIAKQLEMLGKKLELAKQGQIETHAQNMMLESARRSAAMDTWEAAHNATALEHEVTDPAQIVSIDEETQKSLNFRFGGPTLKKADESTGAMMVRRDAQRLSNDPASPFSTSLLVHIQDGRSFVYNDFAEANLVVTVYVGGNTDAANIGINARDAKQVDNAHGSVIAVETTATPNTLVQMYGLRGDVPGEEADSSAWPTIIAFKCETKPIPQWRALQLRPDIDETVTSMNAHFNHIVESQGGNLAGVMQQLQRFGVIEFQDVQYMPLFNSLGKDLNHDDHRVNGFRTPSMFLTSEQRGSLTIGRGEPPLGDYHVSHLGGSFVAAAVSAIAQRQSRIDNIFSSTDTAYAPYGRFVVTLLNEQGLWREVVVDHYLPTYFYNLTLASNITDPSELAPGLIEKAFAKINNGSHYKSIDDGTATGCGSGLTSDVLSHLLAFPTKTINLRQLGKDSTLDAGMLMQHVLAGHAVVAVAGNQKAVSAGLYAGHGYTIVRATRSDDQILFRLRNPSGGIYPGFTSGAYSNGTSKDWGEDHQELAQACRVIEAKDDNDRSVPGADSIPNPAYFWATWDEITDVFDSCHICEVEDRKCKSDYRVCSSNSTTTAQHPLGVLINVHSACEEVMMAATLHITTAFEATSRHFKDLPPIVFALFEIDSSTTTDFTEATVKTLHQTVSPNESEAATTTVHRHSLKAILEPGKAYLVRPVPIDQSSLVDIECTIAVQTDTKFVQFNPEAGDSDEAVVSTVFARAANGTSEAQFLKALVTTPTAVSGGFTLFADAAPFQVRESWDSKPVDRFGSGFTLSEPKTLPKLALGAADAPSNQEAQTSATAVPSNANAQQGGKQMKLVDTSSIGMIDSPLPRDSEEFKKLLAVVQAVLETNTTADPANFADMSQRLHKSITDIPELGLGWFVIVGSDIGGHSFTSHNGVSFYGTFGNVEVLCVRPTIPKQCAACGKYITTKFYNFYDKYGAYVHQDDECLENFRLQRAPTCKICNEKIRTWAGKYYNMHDGKIHEGECYEKLRKSNAQKCAHCGEPLLDKWLCDAKDPNTVFHEECAEGFKLARAPKCVICHEPITGQFYDTAAGKIHPGECYDKYKSTKA